MPAYNVSGAPKNLKLSGEVLADIYLGKITSWDDPAIAKLNPGASLPSTKITPVYRSDGSGDTYAFTNYLSTIRPGIQVEGRHLDPGQVPDRRRRRKERRRRGGDRPDRRRDRLRRPRLRALQRTQHAAGRKLGRELPEPGVKSVEAAAAAVSKIGPNNEISLADLPSSAKGAYPISTYTYVIVPLETEKADALKKFITYAIGPRPGFGPDLDFAPLPKQVVAAGKKAIAKIGS